MADSLPHAAKPELRRMTGAMMGAIAVQITAYVLGFALCIALFFASAFITDSPTVMIITALLGGAAIIALGSHVCGKLLRLKAQKLYVLAQTGLLSVLFYGLAAHFALQPLVPKAEQFVADKTEGVEFWELPTGSQIAVRKFASQTDVTKTPIIILHGGPGAYSVAFQPMLEVFPQLTADGHRVYFYDQVGGGLSERLEDISEYSLDRHIADLKAVHDRIGSEKAILIGSSWGATLAANYLVKHPNDVERIIFSGPGPIYLPDWPENSDGNLDAKMNPQQRERFSAAIEKPRLFAALILADINPKAAVRFATEQEVGSFFDKIANDHYLPLAMCEPKKATMRSNGYGFWASRMTGKTLANRTDDPKPILMKNNLPVLVLRGSCDYKNKALAEQYASTFPNSKFVEFQNAGHMIYGESPEELLRVVREFLR